MSATTNQHHHHHQPINYLQMQASDKLLKRAGLAKAYNGDMSSLAVSTICSIRRGHIRIDSTTPALQQLLASMTGVELKII